MMKGHSQDMPEEEARAAKHRWFTDESVSQDCG